MSNKNDCVEIPSHIAAKHHAPYPNKPAIQHLHDELAENVAGPQATDPTGYVSHCQPVRQDVFGSGSDWYGEHWDSGFAGEGDPYGIQSEYVAQSASPNASFPGVSVAAWDATNNIPTQQQADAEVARAQAERNERANDIAL